MTDDRAGAPFSVDPAVVARMAKRIERVYRTRTHFFDMAWVETRERKVKARG
jgi:hypothetical protein